MALTDVLFGSRNSAVAARGNVGVLVDILAKKMAGYRFITVPAVGDVKLGVLYGRQGTQYTGTYAGGGGGAVFPAASYVAAGVTYGPTGADYTGNVTQPAPSDVTSGVQYGANGTQYTGTATGGGGVTTWMRAR